MNRSGPTRTGFSKAEAAVLIFAAVLFVLLVVGPLTGLFLRAPFPQMLQILAAEETRQALLLTFHSSVLAVLLSVALGLPTAVCLARLDFRGKGLLNALVELPVALPPLVLGVSLLLIWGRRGVVGQFLADAGYPLSFTFAAVVIAQFVVASPFFVRIAKTTIEQVPRSLEEASATLGRSMPMTYLLVTLPLAGRGLFGAALTAWARAVGEFGATIIFAGSFPGRTQTAPLAIFSLMQANIDAAVALALVMVLLSVVAFVLAQFGLRRLTATGELT